jgi:hypothetical protein
MNLEIQILHLLHSRPGGLTIGELEAVMRQQGNVPNPGSLECILRLSSKFSCKAARWLRKTDSKTEAVIAAFERHVQTTGRHLFKAETALASLPVESKPTEDELVSILSESKSFEVLRNGMIQYKT